MTQATKTDIAELKGELKTDIAELKTQMRILIVLTAGLYVPLAVIFFGGGG